MDSQNKQKNTIGKRIRRGGWVILGSVTLLALALLGGSDAWAAPSNKRLNQTIPRPTPTAEATEVPTVTPTTPAQSPTDTPPPANPTATPVSGGGGGGGGGSAPSNPPPTNTPASGSVTATSVPTFALRLQLAMTPTIALQGSQITLRFVITNPGNTAATNVQLRNELPSTLSLVESSVNGGTASTEQSRTGATTLLLKWPSLAAGARAEATVRLRVAPNTPNGTVIDNLAVAWADNAAPFTAGISIGMPPALLPTFD